MTVVPRGSQVSGNAAGTSSGNFTVASPSSTVAGDYLVVLLATNKDTVTPPSGWTLLQNGVSASLASQSLVYGRVAAASGTTNFTWNLSNTTAAPNVAVCWAFGNVDTAHIVSAKGAEDTTSPATAPSVTTTVKSLLLRLVADRRGSTPSITWTFPGGYTKTEGTNDGSVGYTASGGTDGTTVAAGAQSSVNITGSASPSTSFAYTVALGDALTQVTAGDNSTNVIESAAIQANIAGADTGSSADTAAVLVPVPVNDTGTGADTATVRVYAADVGAETSSVRITSGGATLVFASDAATGTEGVNGITIPASDSFAGTDLLETSTVGIQGPYPPGPRVVYVMPAENS